MNEKEFNDFIEQGISEGCADHEFRLVTNKWMKLSGKYGYSYRQKFLGVPIIQLPSDIVAIQSLIFEARPDVIIETGVARGGSIVMSATFLALLDIYDGIYCSGLSKRMVIGIDKNIYQHTYTAIKECPFNSYISLIEGDSNADDIVGQVSELIDNISGTVLVFLDSNHTRDHVYLELINYSKFVSVGSYIVVFDTSIEFDDPEAWKDHRPWGRGNSPYTALIDFMNSEHGRGFEIDYSLEKRIEMTVCYGGFIKRTA